MNYSLYDVTVPAFTALLGQMKTWLDKAEAHATTLGYDAENFCGARLVVDMLPLTRQVLIACDAAKLCMVRVAGVKAPVFEDKESTLAELKARIQATIDFLASITPEQINPSADRQVEWKIRDKMMSAKALHYVTRWALPNFYFHLTTTYNLLRKNGVALGKPDFIGTF